VEGCGKSGLAKEVQHLVHSAFISSPCPCPPQPTDESHRRGRSGLTLNAPQESAVAEGGHSMTHGEQGSLILINECVSRRTVTTDFCCHLWHTASALRDGRYALTRSLPSREKGSRVSLDKDVLEPPRLQHPWALPTGSVDVHLDQGPWPM
jgi:hypothetical protein